MKTSNEMCERCCGKTTIWRIHDAAYSAKRDCQETERHVQTGKETLGEVSVMVLCCQNTKRTVTGNAGKAKCGRCIIVRENRF